MSNTIPPGANPQPGTKEHFAKTLQGWIDALRRNESPEKVLPKDELRTYRALGKTRFIERLEETIEYDKVADHW